MIIIGILIICIVLYSLKELYELILYIKNNKNNKQRELHSREHILYLFFYIITIIFLFIGVLDGNILSYISNNIYMQWGLIFFIMSSGMLIRHIEKERMNNFKI